DEELAPAVCPAERARDRPRTSLRLVELVVARVGIGLEQAGEAGEMLARMDGRSVPGIAEDCGRRRPTTEGPVVANYVHRRPVTVLPLASTGTVVSSPCSRCAAKTWASRRS